MGLYQLQLYGSSIELSDYTKVFRPRLADLFILDTLCMSLVRLPWVDEYMNHRFLFSTTVQHSDYTELFIPYRAL